jgi:hypothetical protein
MFMCWKLLIEANLFLAEDVDQLMLPISVR